MLPSSNVVDIVPKDRSDVLQFSNAYNSYVWCRVKCMEAHGANFQQHQLHKIIDVMGSAALINRMICYKDSNVNHLVQFLLGDEHRELHTRKERFGDFTELDRHRHKLYAEFRYFHGMGYDIRLNGDGYSFVRKLKDMRNDIIKRSKMVVVERRPSSGGCIFGNGVISLMDCLASMILCKDDSIDTFMEIVRQQGSIALIDSLAHFRDKYDARKIIKYVLGGHYEIYKKDYDKRYQEVFYYVCMGFDVELDGNDYKFVRRYIFDGDAGEHRLRGLATMLIYPSQPRVSSSSSGTLPYIRGQNWPSFSRNWYCEWGYGWLMILRPLPCIIYDAASEPIQETEMVFVSPYCGMLFGCTESVDEFIRLVQLLVDDGVDPAGAEAIVANRNRVLLHCPEQCRNGVCTASIADRST